MKGCTTAGVFLCGLFFVGFTQEDSTMIKINGKEANEACSMTVSEYLEANNYNPKHIVVELNEQILPKSEYFTTTIADGDVMEVLSFMGGG